MLKRNASALGLDLSDRTFNFCRLTEGTSPPVEGKRRLTKLDLSEVWALYPADVVVIEAGTPSSWVADHLVSLGARVIVADPRKLRAVTADVRKSDLRDARMLARLGLADEDLVAPTYVRSVAHRRWMALLKARDQLVRVRTATILEVRSQVKVAGGRLPPCTTKGFERCQALLPADLAPLLGPSFDVIRSVNVAISQLDDQIEAAGKADPDVQRLRRVHGVGPITALAFVAVVGDPTRFARTRDVGAYLGMVPGRSQSGDDDPQMRITKAGCGFLRRLLVQCAQFLIGPFAKDCTLRRKGLALVERMGPKLGRRKAVIAIARKLAVVLLSLWKRQTDWQPLHRVADVQSGDAPQPVVDGECALSLGAFELVTETAPPPATQTQPCTAPKTGPSANGSAGQPGATPLTANRPRVERAIPTPKATPAPAARRRPDVDSTGVVDRLVRRPEGDAVPAPNSLDNLRSGP